MATIRFTTDLHAEVYVSVKGENPRALRRAVLDTLRACGALGWRSGTVPPGGYRFPLANEASFDWRLIGARRGTCAIDGDEREGVWHAGLFYSRRELREQERKRLKHAVNTAAAPGAPTRPRSSKTAGANSDKSRSPCSAVMGSAPRNTLCPRLAHLETAA
ncbi:MAG: single-stranded DNA-binding protein [Longimicrobiales bacterium]